MGVVGIMTIALICAGLSFLYVSRFVSEPATPEFYWSHFALLVPITILGFVVMHLRISKKIKSGAMTFVFYSTVKILLTGVYLGPFLINKDDNTKSFVLQFMVLFFGMLFFETFLFTRLLNKKKH